MKKLSSVNTIHTFKYYSIPQIIQSLQFYIYLFLVEEPNFTFTECRERAEKEKEMNLRGGNNFGIDFFRVLDVLDELRKQSVLNLFSSVPDFNARKNKYA